MKRVCEPEREREFGGDNLDCSDISVVTNVASE